MVTLLDVIDKFVGLPRNDVEMTLEYIGAVMLAVIFVYIILWVIVKIGGKIVS